MDGNDAAVVEDAVEHGRVFLLDEETTDIGNVLETAVETRNREGTPTVFTRVVEARVTQTWLVWA